MALSCWGKGRPRSCTAFCVRGKFGTKLCGNEGEREPSVFNIPSHGQPDRGGLGPFKQSGEKLMVRTSILYPP